ncbi:MAG: hypothetical protein QMC39_07860 [Flavobacteriales bacterium]
MILGLISAGMAYLRTKVGLKVFYRPFILALQYTFNPLLILVLQSFNLC